MNLKSFLPLLLVGAVCALPARAAQPDQPWTQALARLSGPLNAAGELAKPLPANTDWQARNNAMFGKLESLSERLGDLTLAFGEVLLNPALTTAQRTAFLTQSGSDLSGLSAKFAALAAAISANYGGKLGGDFLVSLAKTLDGSLESLLSSYSYQAAGSGLGGLRDPCAPPIGSGGITTF